MLASNSTRSQGKRITLFAGCVLAVVATAWVGSSASMQTSSPLLEPLYAPAKMQGTYSEIARNKLLFNKLGEKAATKMNKIEAADAAAAAKKGVTATQSSEATAVPLEGTIDLKAQISSVDPSGEITAATGTTTATVSKTTATAAAKSAATKVTASKAATVTAAAATTASSSGASPSPLLFIGVLALAAVAFFVTQGGKDEVAEESKPLMSTPPTPAPPTPTTSTPAPVATPTSTPPPTTMASSSEDAATSSTSAPAEEGAVVEDGGVSKETMTTTTTSTEVPVGDESV